MGLVLHPRRRSAFGEWPDPVLELQREEAVVMACRLQRAMPRVKAELRTAPVRTSGLCTRVNKCGRVEVLRAVARCGHSRRIEVGDRKSTRLNSSHT